MKEKKKEEEKPKSPEERLKELVAHHSPLRLQVDNLYDLQKVRISMQLRQYAYIDRLGLDKKDPKVKDLMLNVTALLHVEKQLNKDIMKQLVKYPVYVEWLRRIKGLAGPRIAGGLIAWTESFNKETEKMVGIERFSKVSSYWKYTGLDVTPEGNAPKRAKGEKGTWNPKLKTHVIYKVGSQMIKTKGLYQELYRKFKREYQEAHPEKVLVRTTSSGKKVYKYTKLHIHNMARRKMCKILLQHLWVVWREIERLPVTKPWALEHGHTDYIAPPAWG